jgi:hypothetical protein
VIERESNGRVLVCSICEDTHAVRHEIAVNPESMAIEMEDVAADHFECDKYPHDAPRARRERQTRKRAEKAKRLLDAARFGGRRV